MLPPTHEYYGMPAGIVKKNSESEWALVAGI